MAVFHRTALADDLAARLLKPSATSASGSGLFLAAPALQDKALVWRATRGVYALEDTFLAELMGKAGML